MKMRKSILTTSVLTALIAFAASAATAQSNPSQTGPTPTSKKDEAASKVGKSGGGAIVKSARVFFVEPKDGATVTSPFKVKFGLEGLKLAKAGAAVPGTGHHHLIVDGGSSPKGAVIGKDATHLHFGDAQTETTLTLPKGKHKLTLQFADGTHASYGEEMSSTITVDVR